MKVKKARTHWVKFASVALVLAMALLMLAGCGGTPSSTAAPASAAPAASTAGADSTGTDSGTLTTANIEGKHLVFLTSERQYPGEEDAWAEIIADFEAETGCTVEARFEGKWDDKITMLSTAKMAGEQVDITTNGGNALNSIVARSGTVMDLTELAAPLFDRFTESAMSGHTIGGHVFGLPIYGVSVCGIFYNVDMFTENDIEVPTTYEEFKGVVDQLSQLDGVMPLAQQGKANYYWPMWYMETYAQSTGNTSIASLESFLSGEKQFTGEAEIEAFNLIKQFFDDGILDSSCLDMDTDSLHALFIQEKAAMFQGGSWEYPAVVDDCDFEVGIFPFPVMIDGTIEQCGSGADEGYNIASWIDPDNIPAALAFLEFVSRKENAQKITDCMSPIATSVVGVPGLDLPIKEVVETQLAPNAIPFLDWIWPAEINTVFKSAIPQVAIGEITAEQACQEVQDAYDQLVAETGYSYNWYDQWTADEWAAVTPTVFPEIIMG